MRTAPLLCCLALLLSLGTATAQVIYSEDQPVERAAQSPDNPHSGKQCVAWRHGESERIAFTGVPTDWTPYDTLSLWLRTDTPAGASFLVYIPSENPQSEGQDYYSAHVSVSPGPWQHVLLRFPEELGASRQPRGWNQIEGLAFTASGWDQKLNKEAVVYVDDVSLTKEGPIVGPRLTDEDFFAALNLELPELAAVKAAVAAGDMRAARAAYVQYLRSLPHPFRFDWRARPAKPEDKPNTRAADETLKRRFVVCSVPYDFQGGDLDWDVNPTNPVNNEWIWQFGRHAWWTQLGRAYWATGDEKYVREFVYNVNDWIRDCPVPRGKASQGPGSHWRTIECGIRMSGSWPESFFYFLGSPSFDVDTVITMVKSIVEHARYLALYPTSGNWLTMEANGLYHVGALFPEFKEAAAWRDTAAGWMYRELDAQVYADGAQIELSTGYHQVSLYNFKELLDIAKITQQRLPEDYLAKLERMWAYNMWVMMPDGAAPAINDSGYGDMRRTLQEGLTYFPGRADWQWLVTRGAQGAPPAETSHACKWAGHYIMRSGWGPQDVYGFFDAGPFGYGHQHEDKLAFLLSAYGSRLLIDTGIYTYDASDWRRYVLGPNAHNTVFIDGKGQNRRGEPRESYVNKAEETNPWFSNASFDYAAGEYAEGFGPSKERLARQRREIIFIKPDYFLLIDTLTPADAASHEYTSYLHLRPAEAAVQPDGRSVLTDNGAGANLMVLPVTSQALSARVIKGQQDPLLGWTLKSGLECEPIPVAAFTWQTAGENTVAYVLYPLKPGEKALPQVQATADGLTVRVGERVDEIHLGATPRLTLTRRQGGQPDTVLRLDLP